MGSSEVNTTNEIIGENNTVGFRLDSQIQIYKVYELPILDLNLDQQVQSKSNHNNASLGQILNGKKTKTKGI